MQMLTSTDGGRTWGPGRASADNAHGLGGQPVVRPDGTVVVPHQSSSGQIRSFRSTNGGTSWGTSMLVSPIRHHRDAGGLRSGALPSAEIDAAGTTYVAWSDCRFRTGCPANDIVVSKSTTGATWSAAARVPIHATTNAVDHFEPGIGVDKSTSGGSARIGLTYYLYPTSNCTAATCRLDVGFISSTNGGTSWSAATQVAGPMNLSWLPNTSQGRMFGDYISTSVRPGGNAFPVVPIGHAPTGTTFDLAMYVPTGGLSITGGTRRATEAPTSADAATAPTVRKPCTDQPLGRGRLGPARGIMPLGVEGGDAAPQQGFSGTDGGRDAGRLPRCRQPARHPPDGRLVEHVYHRFAGAWLATAGRCVTDRVPGRPGDRVVGAGPAVATGCVRPGTE
jgi:hypothetical protein